MPESTFPPRRADVSAGVGGSGATGGAVSAGAECVAIYLSTKEELPPSRAGFFVGGGLFSKFSSRSPPFGGCKQRMNGRDLLV